MKMVAYASVGRTPLPLIELENVRPDSITHTKGMPYCLHKVHDNINYVSYLIFYKLHTFLYIHLLYLLRRHECLYSLPLSQREHLTHVRSTNVRA